MRKKERREFVFNRCQTARISKKHTMKLRTQRGKREVSFWSPQERITETCFFSLTQKEPRSSFFARPSSFSLLMLLLLLRPPPCLVKGKSSLRLRSDRRTIRRSEEIQVQTDCSSQRKKSWSLVAEGLLYISFISLARIEKDRMNLVLLSWMCVHAIASRRASYHP